MRLLLLVLACCGFASRLFGQNQVVESPYNESPPRYTVALTPEGLLQGWAGYLDSSTGEFEGGSRALVHLIREGRIIEQVETQNAGRFEVSGLLPGTYSVVVIDERGFAASAFQIVSAEQEAAHGSLVCTMVAHEDFQLATGADGTLAMEPAADCCPPLDLAGCPTAGGGGGGGAGGGGGGFGGLLGWGLGATGLGFGIAALADDDGDAAPASPVFP